MGIKHNRQIEEYLNNICTHIKHSEVHQQIRLELEDHIEEITAEYISQGTPEDEAVNKAIAQMGDAAHIGKRLNQIHKPRPEWSILALTLLFTSLGLAALFFIQNTVLAVPFPMFELSLGFFFTGTVILVGIYFFDYRKIRPYSKYIYLGTMLVLTYTIFWGIQANGSKSWLSIGPFFINFVQVSPYLFIVALAGIFDNWDWSNSKQLLYALLLLLVPPVLILGAPSLSAAVIYLIASIVLSVVSGLKLKHVLVVMVSGIGVLLLFIMSAPYRLERFFVFLNPASDPQGVGYLYLQIKKAISTSGLLGQGFTLQPGLIPEIHTDFIFTYIIYTFGWIAGFIIASLTVLFLVRIARIALVVKTNYARLVISGLAAIFTAQFLWNILMNLGAAPISGIGLPFISYGGSQFVMNMAAIGLISSVYRRKNIYHSLG